MVNVRAQILAVLCLSVASANAGGTPDYILAFSGSKSTAIAIQKTADYVSMSLTIHSDQRKPEARFAEIRQAEKLILNKAGSREGILVHKGPVSLSPGPVSKLASLSSSPYTIPSSIAQLALMVKIDEKTDVYACGTKILRFLESIEMPGKTSCSLGGMQLAVASPEQYRQEILKEITRDVALVKSAMQTTGAVSITGLERPVLVRQVDDRKVELFINYSMTVVLSNETTGGDR